LRHPNIVRAFSRGDDYYVMELLRKVTPTSDLIDSGADWPIGQRLRIVRTVTDTLDELHSHGIVHRDVKPSNIVVDGAGVVRLIDFGTAKNVENAYGLTVDDEALGTPAYMSPEQASDCSHADPSFDVYSLGATLYEFLTLERPYDHYIDGTTGAVLACRSTTVSARFALVYNPRLSIAPPSSITPGVPPELDDIVMCALHPDAAQRYPSMQRFSEDLGTYLDREDASVLKQSSFAGMRKATTRRFDVGVHAAEAAPAPVSPVPAGSNDAPSADQQTPQADVRLTVGQKTVIAAGGILLATAVVWAWLQAHPSEPADEATGVPVIASRPTTPVQPTDASSAPVPGQAWTVPGLGMELAWIDALGAWFGRYEVSNAEFRCFAPTHSSATYDGNSLNGDRQPVVTVDLHDAAAFARWLSDGEEAAGRLPDGFCYRLATISEWRTVAQCGDHRAYPWGNQWPPTYGNYSDSTSAWSSKSDAYTDGFPVTCAVDLSGENEWGIFGLSGNVREWVRAPSRDTAAAAGTSWGDFGLRGFRCNKAPPNLSADHKDAFVGFRIMLGVAQPDAP